MYCNIEKKNELCSCIILFYGGFVLLWKCYRIMVAIHNLTRHSVVNLGKIEFWNDRIRQNFRKDVNQDSVVNLDWHLFQNSQLQLCF